MKPKCRRQREETKRSIDPDKESEKKITLGKKWSKQ